MTQPTSINRVISKKKKTKKKNSLQHEVFPGGQPSKYYPRPTGFDFGERVPVLFLWYDRRQRTLVNLCHIGVSKGKTVNLRQL